MAISTDQIRRRTAWTLRLSGVYDLLGFVLLLWMPVWLLDFFGHPMPAEPFLFRLAALPLLLLPVIYFLAAMDPPGRLYLVRACVFLRVLGGLAILQLLIWQKPVAPWAYFCFAVGDFLWAGFILVFSKGLSASESQ